MLFAVPVARWNLSRVDLRWAPGRIMAKGGHPA
jgi:hypothetical protein